MEGQKVNRWIIQKNKYKVHQEWSQEELKKESGIYAIVNIINGHHYIGQSRSIGERFISHKQLLRTKKHGNPYLQHAWNKYGEANFKFVVIEVCDRCDLDDREQYWIERLNPVYNIVRNIYKFWEVRSDYSREETLKELPDK